MTDFNIVLSKKVATKHVALIDLLRSSYTIDAVTFRDGTASIACDRRVDYNRVKKVLTDLGVKI